MKHKDIKITDIANCKTSKNSLLATEYPILIIYYYQTAKTRALYESSDEPARQPANNLPYSDGLRDCHWTVPESRVQVHWRPGRPIWQRFGSNEDMDLKRRSGMVANTMEVSSFYSFTMIVFSHLAIIVVGILSNDLCLMV